MRRFVLSLLFVGFAAFVSGCGETTDPGTETPEAGSETSATETTHEEHAAVLCGKCGEDKSSDSCCAEGAEKCEGCSLTKGSPLCCKDLGEELAGKDVCTGCGHGVEANEHHHCDKECETCDKCGLHEGAPACCKLGEKKKE